MEKLRMIAAVLLSLTAVAAQNLETFTASYGPFDSSYNGIVDLANSATIFNGLLLLTPNNPDQKGLLRMPLENQYGRVMLKQRFKLWEQGNKKTSERVASFNSSFLFNLYALESLDKNNTPGEGLAFVLAADKDPPSNSFGPYLGLTNFHTDGSPVNRLVAIEFDTFEQAFDPDANHVGLNINSIISTVNASLTPLGIKLAPRDGEVRFYNAWVQYDGVNKVIEVYIAQQAELYGETPSRPDNPVLKSNLDLREVLDQHSYFGFSASTGNNVQLNSVLRWNLTVESYPEEKHVPRKTIFITVGVGIPPLVMVGVMMGCYYTKKKRSMTKSKSNVLLGALKRLPGTPREFQFKDLKKATNNFDDKKKLGQGGFGVVYRGYMQKENLEVAVKWFSRENVKGQDNFLAELTIINRLRHKHLVPLLGWCHNKRKLLLVYDYMPNGSLDAHLFPKTLDSVPLSWARRYKIISGVALAVQYLHNEYDQRVVHRDIKASNIMLDFDFNARLGDFGLARALDKEKSSYTEAEGVAGTHGYIAPECFLTRKATQQSDLYAFGIVLLEIVCGLPRGTRIDEFHFLVDWVWFKHRDGRIIDVVDERLGDEYVVEEAQKILILALACSHPIAGERPTTERIVQIISGLAPVPYVPPFKPAFVWPSMPSVGQDDISSLSGTTESMSFPTTHLGSGLISSKVHQQRALGQ